MSSTEGLGPSRGGIRVGDAQVCIRMLEEFDTEQISNILFNAYIGWPEVENMVKACH